MAKQSKVHFSVEKISQPNLAPNSGGWLDTTKKHITREDKSADPPKLSKSQPRTGGPFYFTK
jgi:hypothetical protein